jgi:CubicO group peptidase (beta-lactamase class C family)
VSIFDRLDMQGSGYDRRATIVKGRAEGYSVKDGKFENSIFIDMSVPYAAGSLYSTVDDLYRWDRALYTDKVLNAKSREAMYTPLKSNYAYGWVVRDAPRKSYEHGGGIPGFSTYIARYPADDALVVVLSNIESAPAGKIAGDLAHILFNEKYELLKNHTAIQIDPKIFDRYTGKYQLGQMTFLIAAEDGKLFPESETDFFLTVVDAQITFNPGADGKAAELVLHQNGANMTAKRVP